MDPITALSVASSVVALIDFSGKLVYRTFEIAQSSSGQPQQAIEVQKCSQELTSVALEVRERVRGLEARYPRHAKLMERINVECVEIKQRMTEALGELTVKSSSRGLARLGSVVQVTIRSFWSAEQFREWSAKLNSIRDQVMMSVIICLLDEVQETRKHVQEAGSHSTVVMETLGRIESRLDKLQSGSSAEQMSNPGNVARDGFADALWTWSELFNLPVQVENSPPIPSSEQTSRTERTKKIMDSLAFDGMVSRHDGIRDAFPETFKWVFEAEEDSGVNRAASQSFTHWLESETDKAFWVTGKPASGKSTLMKFISTDDSLPRYLRKWTAERDPLIGYFYFWGPGSVMQKSLAGLLRSLLHQLLSQRLDLCDSIAIRRQTLFSVAGNDTQSPAWSLEELEECLSRFASQTRENGRIALFIDGLDEFEGQHTELISFLKHLQQDHGAKFCVSSRPWVVFSDAFKQNPTLRMEDLTRPDINKYITGRFAQSVVMDELGTLDPKSVQNLKDAIADRAEGVFLWVAIVVEQILLKAAQTPDLDEIWKIYNSLPADLESLYKKIHDDLDPTMRETSSKLYRMVLAWKLHVDDLIDPVHCWLAITCKNPALKVEYPPESSRDAIAVLIARLLAGHTRGLLQIHPWRKSAAYWTCSTTIDFIHRTAFDWLRLPEQFRELQVRSPGFEPLLHIMAVAGAYIRCRPNDRAAHWQRFFHICSQMDHVSMSKEALNAVLSQFQLLEPSLEPILNLIPRRYKDYIGDGIILHPLETLASIYCCPTYLRAKYEDGYQYSRNKPRLLTAAVYGLPWEQAR